MTTPDVNDPDYLASLLDGGITRDLSHAKVKRYVKMTKHDWDVIGRKIREIFPK